MLAETGLAFWTELSRGAGRLIKPVSLLPKRGFRFGSIHLGKGSDRPKVERHLLGLHGGISIAPVGRAALAPSEGSLVAFGRPDEVAMASDCLMTSIMIQIGCGNVTVFG